MTLSASQETLLCECFLCQITPQTYSHKMTDNKSKTKMQFDQRISLERHYIIRAIRTSSRQYAPILWIECRPSNCWLQIDVIYTMNRSIYATRITACRRYILYISDLVTATEKVSWAFRWDTQQTIGSMLYTVIETSHVVCSATTQMQQSSIDIYGRSLIVQNLTRFTFRLMKEVRCESTTTAE